MGTFIESIDLRQHVGDVGQLGDGRCVRQDIEASQTSLFANNHNLITDETSDQREYKHSKQ